MLKLWFIPTILSVICGILNPYAGAPCCIVGAIGFFVLFFMDRKIHKDISKLENTNEKNEIKYEISKTMANSWFLTSFAFTLINAVLNTFLYFLSFNDFTKEPQIIFSRITVFADNFALCKILFIANIVMLTVSTIMIYLENVKLCKKFKATNVSDEAHVEKHEDN